MGVWGLDRERERKRERERERERAWGGLEVLRERERDWGFKGLEREGGMRERVGVRCLDIYIER